MFQSQEWTSVIRQAEKTWVNAASDTLWATEVMCLFPGAAAFLGWFVAVNGAEVISDLSGLMCCLIISDIFLFLSIQFFLNQFILTERVYI